MLPLITLQTSDLASFDTGLNSAELLPQEAAEPSAAFADLLRLGVAAAKRQLPVDGIPLPESGNDLPVTVMAELEADVSEQPEAAPLASLQVELLHPAEAMPVTGAVTGNGRLAEALGATPPTAGQSGAPITPVRQDDLATRIAALQGQYDGEQPAANGTLRPGVKPVDAAAVLPVPQPRPVAGSAADTPSVSAVASQIQEEILPTLRRPVAAAPTAVAANTADTGTAAGAAAAERTAPIASLLREQLPADRRPVEPVAATVQSVQAVQTLVSSGEAPAAQQPAPASLAQVQATTQAPSTAPTAIAQLSQSIDIPVRDAAWGEAVGERVALMASNRLQSAEIRLSPAELGPLRVQVAVDDGLANVTFHAQHAVTREAIEQALPRLRELLADNGLTLNQANVGQDNEQGVLQGNRDHDQAEAGQAGAAEPGVEQEAQDLTAVSRPNARPDGLVDTFV